MSLFLLPVLALLAWPQAAQAHVDGNFPIYIFQDTRFWFFLLCNAVVTFIGAWHVVRLLSRRHDPPTQVASFLTRPMVWVFMTAYILQSFHHVEHVAQVYQYWLLQLPAEESHGIIFFADLEWNHFLFNTSYELLLIIAAVGLLRAMIRAGQAHSFNLFIVIYPLIVQGWHVVEHSVRIVRHVQLGCNPCGGILDTSFSVPLIPLHYWFDLTMLFLQGVVFLWFGFPSVLRRRKQRSMAAAAADMYAQPSRPAALA